MGNCCLKCKNTNRRIKRKAKEKNLLTHRRGDNGDILNHIEALLTAKEADLLSIEQNDKNEPPVYIVDEWLEQQQQNDDLDDRDNDTNDNEHDTMLYNSIFDIKTSKFANYMKNICDLNANYEDLEVKFKEILQNFLIPRSQSYSQDLDLLKLFFNNFNLELGQPNSYKSLNKSIIERSYTFLLSTKDFNVKLNDLDRIDIEINEKEDLETPDKHDLEYEFLNDNCGRLRFIKKVNKCLNKKQQSLLSSSSLHSKTLLDTNNNQNFYYLSHAELNERLQTCLLSNFARLITDSFINNDAKQQCFVKKSSNREFLFIKMSKFDLNCLEIDYYNFKFCIKLNEWPDVFDLAYFKRNSRQWPSNDILNTIKTTSCALTGDFKDDLTWTIDYSYAFMILFKSLDNQKKFIYFFIRKCFMDYLIELNLDEYVDIFDRILLNNYFIYLELNYLNVKFNFKQNLLKIFRKFIKFLRDLYLNHEKNLNLPNYFNFKLQIMNNFSTNSYLNRNFLEILDKLCKQIDYLLKINLNNLKTINSNVYLKENCKIFDDFPLKCPKLCTTTCLYEYLFDYLVKFHDIFNLKRDSFNLTQDILLKIHFELLESNDKLKLSINNIDNNVLIEQIEKYSTIVNSYLPQIRSKHAHLQFHNIWTMHIQRLLPFLNYIIDLYYKHKTKCSIFMLLQTTNTPPLSISSVSSISSSSLLSSVSQKA